MLGNMDFTETKEFGKFDRLPEGTYKVIIESIDRVNWMTGQKVVITNDKTKPTSDDKLEISMQIVGDHYKGAKHSENLSLWAESDQVRNISKSKLVSIVKLCGYEKDEIPTLDFKDLLDKPFGIKIKHTEKDGKTYTNISKFLTIEELNKAVKEENGLPGFND